MHFKLLKTQITLNEKHFKKLTESKLEAISLNLNNKL